MTARRKNRKKAGVKEGIRWKSKGRSFTDDGDSVRYKKSWVPKYQEPRINSVFYIYYLFTITL